MPISRVVHQDYSFETINGRRCDPRKELSITCGICSTIDKGLCDLSDNGKFYIQHGSLFLDADPNSQPRLYAQGIDQTNANQIWVYDWKNSHLFNVASGKCLEFTDTGVKMEICSTSSRQVVKFVDSENETVGLFSPDLNMYLVANITSNELSSTPQKFNIIALNKTKLNVLVDKPTYTREWQTMKAIGGERAPNCNTSEYVTQHLVECTYPEDTQVFANTSVSRKEETSSSKSSWIAVIIVLVILILGVIILLR
jgi:hypothetical protein